MTVTDITEISKTKVRVCVNNDVTFTLYKNELRKYHIRNDAELSEELYHHIMDEVLRKRAKLRCMNLLKSRDYTEYQLRMKLKQGLYPEEIIDDAVAYVISFGYVNDIQYAEKYIRYASTTKSRKQVEDRLLGKGISKENIKQAFGWCAKDDDLTSEDEIIERLLEKKHFDSQKATYEERQKIMGFLYRRGFSMDKICKAVEYNA